MSFLDYIPGIGQALDTGAALLTNAANAKQAQLNRDFQERMSSTAHQREVADYKAAGLNPALAYGRSGESTPSGATATLENPGKGLGSTAAAALQLRNQTNLTKSQIAATNAGAAKTNAETAHQNILNEVARERADLELRALRLGNNKTYEEGDRLRLENQMARDTWEPRFRMAQATLDNLKQNTATAEASAKLSAVETALKNYDLPAARAAAKAAETWVGQNMAPWLEPVLKLLTVFLRGAEVLKP